MTHNAWYGAPAVDPADVRACSGADTATRRPLTRRADRPQAAPGRCLRTAGPAGAARGEFRYAASYLSRSDALPVDPVVLPLSLGRRDAQTVDLNGWFSILRVLTASGGSRPKLTIEETAELVSGSGGNGVAIRVDHLVPEEVQALLERIRTEHGRLDVLVNDVSDAAKGGRDAGRDFRRWSRTRASGLDG